MRNRIIGLGIMACLATLGFEARRIKFDWMVDIPTVGTVHSSEIITGAELQCIQRTKWIEHSNARNYSADIRIAELADKAKVEQGIRACLAGGKP